MHRATDPDHAPRLLARSAVLAGALALAGGAAAQDLYAGGPSTLVWRGHPQNGGFTLIGACGGVVQSMAADSDGLLLVGDEGGTVYRYDTQVGFLSYMQDVGNDATALVLEGEDFLVGGSDGSILRYASDGSDLLPSATLLAPAPVGALVLIGDVLYVGSSFGVVFRTDLSHDGGVFQFFGTCGGPIQAMQQSGGELLLGTTGGTVYRLDLQSEALAGQYHAGNDAQALALHANVLLVGGSDGSVLRVDPTTGVPAGAGFQLPSGIEALALGGAPAPGFGYCYGLGCPCGNDDDDAGCVSASGQGAHLTGAGSASVATDDLVLSLTQVSPHQYGRMYMGATIIEVPFGNGLLCAGSGGYGQFRFALDHTGPGGFLSVGPGIVDFASGHFGAGGQIFPGSTWFFQAWFRDAAGPCGSSFNTSNAFAVTFQQ